MNKAKDLRKHESQYWHIKRFGLLPLLGVIAFFLISFFNFFLLDWGFSDYETVRSYVFSDIVLVYPFFMEYLFVSGLVISFVALAKGGYSNLKPINKEGLIVGLVWGLMEEFK